MSPMQNCISNDNKQQLLNRLMVFGEYLKREGHLNSDEFMKLVVGEATNDEVSDSMFRNSVRQYISELDPQVIKEFCHPDCKQLQLSLD